MVFITYFPEAIKKDMEYFDNAKDFYTYLHYLRFPNDYFINFCTKYFVDNFSIDIIAPVYLQHSKQMPRDYISKQMLLDYQKFIETTDIEKYFEEFLVFNEFEPNCNIFIACFIQAEFDFLKTKFESVSIVYTENVVDLNDNCITDVYINNRTKLHEFIKSNIYEN